MTSVFDAIGGAPAVAAATDRLYERLLADDLLAHHFEGIDLAGLNSHMRSFLTAALGGADVYKGRDMGAAHAGLGITEPEWDATVGHVVGALQDLGVDPELIGQIGGKLTPLKSQIVTA